MDFQHSQPQSVYRHKSYYSDWLRVAFHLGLAVVLVYQGFDSATSWAWLLIPLLLWSAYSSWQKIRHTRLIISPAGISITDGRSVATSWSNVERLQMIVPEGAFDAVPCLVLREPPVGQAWPVAGLPAEIEDRVIPIETKLWARIAALQQDLYQYLPANPHQPNQLSVPIDLAAADRQRQWFVNTSMAILVTLTVLAALLIKRRMTGSW